MTQFTEKRTKTGNCLLEEQNIDVGKLWLRMSRVLDVQVLGAIYKGIGVGDSIVDMPDNWQVLR